MSSDGFRMQSRRLSNNTRGGPYDLRPTRRRQLEARQAARTKSNDREQVRVFQAVTMSDVDPELHNEQTIAHEYGDDPRQQLKTAKESKRLAETRSTKRGKATYTAKTASK